MRTIGLNMLIVLQH